MPNWTKTRPNKPGHYWYAATDIDQEKRGLKPVESCRVYQIPRMSKPHGLIAEFMRYLTNMDELSGKWIGPIDEPSVPVSQ